MGERPRSPNTASRVIASVEIGYGFLTQLEGTSVYLIRRIYSVKPGEARKAASLVNQLGKAYAAAGTRSDSVVYFNSGTTPGERNTVVMEWTDEVLRTPYRDDRVRAEGIEDIVAQLSNRTLESSIEFWELMTDEKEI